MKPGGGVKSWFIGNGIGVLLGNYDITNKGDMLSQS